MAKEQKPAEATHSTGDSHAVYPTHYDVKIHTLRPEGPCKATASVNINGCFAVRGCQGYGEQQGALCIHAQLQNRERRVQRYLLSLHEGCSDGV